MNGVMFRWLALTVFVACVSISAYHRFRARRAAETIARADEGPLMIAGRLLVALPLFGGVLVYLARPQWMEWASVGAPTWTRWMGAALGFLTVPAVHWVLTSLGANVSETVLTKRDHQLVTSGPYRWVRHPLYTAGIVLFLSIGLMAANWFILGWAFIALLAVRFVVIPREETYLESAFGAEYRTYRLGTGSMLPVPRSARARVRRDG